MSNPVVTPKPGTCGCCGVGLPQLTISNRPGQPTLAYRLGTHATFLQRLLARLPIQAIPDGPNRDVRPLLGLTTRVRVTDDPAIALLDAWATVADVLTFYQERLANEGYLRTVTERRSVLELARAIGYELNPGVAANTFLAFTVQDVPGSPGTATVPQGTRVQSIPAQGQLPQTFETVEEIETRAEWNILRPRMTRPQHLAIHNDDLYLLGTDGSLTAGAADVEGLAIADLYLVGSDIPFEEGATNIPASKLDQIYLKGTTSGLKAGEPLLVVGKKGGNEEVTTLVKRIQRVKIEPELNRTRIDLAEEPRLPRFVQPVITELATVATTAVRFTGAGIKTSILQKSWRHRDLNAFLSINRWSGRQLLQHIAAPPEPKLPPADQGLFAFHQGVSFFGHNAPLYKSLPKSEHQRGDPYPDPPGDWDAANNDTGRDIWTDSQNTKYSVRDDYDVYLERSLPEVLSNSWVVFESTTIPPTAYRVRAVTEASLADYGLSAKATGLRLAQTDGTTAPDKSKAFKVRKTTAHVQSDRTELADLPIVDDLAEGATELMLDGMVLGLQVGQNLILSGERADAPGVTESEVVIPHDIVHGGGYTTLRFKNGLEHTYIRKTVTLNANVARATHGETVAEVLGSGDGTQTKQRFVLKRPPLTYVSASTPSGGDSTLEVRVNDLLWREVPTFFGRAPEERVYVTLTDNDGKTTVMFGDGETGARLPTGQENVVTTYRSGIGPEGEVDAGSLTLLQTRPLGIRGVTNPLPASGAEASEKLDEARKNAPQTVLTLDRIVSLRDFEDFARAFAGIGKAQAVALWSGEAQIVHITVAGANGDEIDTKSDLYNNLRDAINAARDPFKEVLIESFEPLYFNVSAKVVIDPVYKWENVETKIGGALREAFGFEQRAFGQPVAAAEVVSVIQQGEGVMAVDLDELQLVTESGKRKGAILASVLPARMAHLCPLSRTKILPGHPFKKKTVPAQLLLINPPGITLTEMAP